MKITYYTHKGWIGLCPVYIGKPESECPEVDPRFPMTEWLLMGSLKMFDFIGSFMPDDAGMIPIKITGKLNKPITRASEEQ